MRAVWSWMLELCELSRDISAEEGAALLTAAGLEVEAFEPLGQNFSGVVVAEVVAKEPHPKADKLTVVDVIDAAGGRATRVVCGAPNVPEPGGRVLWAKPGAVLPGGMNIGVRPLKGVESHGMLCSEAELGCGSDADGITVLMGEEAGCALGSTAQKALGIEGDAVLDISAPANRPDALGHLGLARELCALVGGRLLSGTVDLAPHTDESLRAADLARVDIRDPEACPRYIARIIDRLSVGPSPGWMRRRLEAVGVRPLSNLVDVTNYVLFELGHPLHAFDYRQVAEARIEVRAAHDGEKMTTLDEQERELRAGDLLICDGKGPVALAGVMGGLDSEVASDTSRVLLEAAAFNPTVIRKTARRIGLHSEASQRFERGVDPEGAERASRRAAQLFCQVAGGVLAQGSVDAYPGPPVKRTIRLRPARASALCGFPIDRPVAREALERLGLDVRDGAGGDLEVDSPSFRVDIAREVDLIEEVLRIHGYDKVPSTLPAMKQAPVDSPAQSRTIARRAMLGSGYSEAITFGFTSPARIEALRLPASDRRSRPLALANPMSVEQSVMRTSLLCNLLGAVARNLKHGVADIALFEVGSVFLPTQPGQLPDEPTGIAAVLCGHRAAQMGQGPEVDFFDLKGAAEELLGQLDLPDVRFVADGELPTFHPGLAARIECQGRVLGYIGEVHPEVRAAFDIGQRCYAFDIDLGAVAEPGPRQMRQVPKFPAVTRDVSLFVPEATPAGRVGDLIDEAADPWIEGVAVLEEYRDPAHVPAGQKGLLWSITYRSHEKTLTDREVDDRHEALVADLVEKLAATRR